MVLALKMSILIVALLLQRGAQKARQADFRATRPSMPCFRSRGGARIAPTALPVGVLTWGPYGAGRTGLLGSIGFLCSGLMPVDRRIVALAVGRPAWFSPV